MADKTPAPKNGTTITAVIVGVALTLIVLGLSWLMFGKKDDSSKQSAASEQIDPKAIAENAAEKAVSGFNGKISELNVNVDSFKTEVNGKFAAFDTRLGNVETELKEFRQDIKEMPDIMRKMMTENAGSVPSGCTSFGVCGRQCPPGTTGYRVRDTLPSGKTVYYIKCAAPRPSKRTGTPTARRDSGGTILGARQMSMVRTGLVQNSGASTSSSAPAVQRNQYGIMVKKVQ